MTDYPFALLTGTALGIFHGAILVLSLISFQLASFLLYGDRYFIPIATTTVIDAVTLFAVITYGWWLPAMMRIQEKYAIKRDEE